MYDYQSSDQALAAYFRWMENVPKELLHVYQPLLLTVEEWGDAIFAHARAKPYYGHVRGIS